MNINADGQARGDTLRPTFPVNRIIFGIVAITCFAALLLLYGLLPGLMPDTAAGLADLGITTCIRNAPGLLDIQCPYAGFPYGAPSTFGLPLHILIAKLAEFTGIRIGSAYYIGYSLIFGIAFVGCIQLFRRVTKSCWIALIGACLFLASPIVALEGGYGPLRIGFALLPTYIYVNILAIDQLKKGMTSIPSAILLLLMLATTHVFAMFCDGYSYVMALLVAGIFWATWLYGALRSHEFRQAAVGIIVAPLSIVISLWLYSAYIPASQYAVEPLAFFRGQGIDLYMFAVPSAAYWAAEFTGWHHSITGYQVYSDGPSSSLVYMGYSFLFCGLVCAWLVARKKIHERRILAIFLIVGAVATLLSIGPALKWHDLRNASGTVTYDNYLMPADKATLNLGTGWIYEHVPGISSMRALYRWQLVARLTLVIAALMVLGELSRRRHHALAALLILALFAETMPAVPHVRASELRASRAINQFDVQAAGPFKEGTSRGNKVLFLQLQPNASHNEYLTTYLCAKAMTFCYNVGGDKNMALASNSWPAPVYEIIANRNVMLNVREVFQHKLVDEIVVPFFDLRTQAYSWPPTDFPREEVIAKLRSQFADYDIRVGQWFAWIRPTAGNEELGHDQYMPNGYADGQVATVSKWGPQSIDPDSKAPIYVWIKTADAPPQTSVAIGNHVLPTLQNSKDVLAAPVRMPADQAILDEPKTYPVYLIDRKRLVKQRLGTVTVNK